MPTKRRSIFKIFATASMAATLGLSASAAEANENLRMSTLGLGTSAYVVLSTFANIINEKMSDVSIRVSSTGAATEHMVQAAEGRIAFFTMSPTMYAALKNKAAMFSELENAPELAENLGVVFNFPAGVYHIVTHADSGIGSLDDLAGKTVFLGPPAGAATQVMVDFVEGASGLRANEDFNVVNLGWNAGHQAFQDRQVDAAVFLGNLPTSSVSQIALTGEIRLLGLEPRHLEAPSEQLKSALDRPGGLTVEIPAGTYGDGQVNEDPTTTLAVTVGLATSLDLDEDLVYGMTKTWWENIEAAHAVAPWMQSVTMDGALTELNAPLHPGAARYYREQGMDVPSDN